MNEKAIYLTLESLFSMVLLLSILFIPINFSKEDFSEIYLLQKSNDLLKVWGKAGSLDEMDLLNDCIAFFPGQRVLIVFEEKTIEWNSNKESENFIKTKGFYVNQFNQLKKIELTVFY